jgi:hypothetical protein
VRSQGEPIEAISNYIWWEGNTLNFVGALHESAVAVYQYDVTLEDSSAFYSSANLYEGTFLGFSPDGNYVAVTNFECGLACLVNLENREVLPVSFERGNSALFVSATEIIWHPVEPWLILTGQTTSVERIVLLRVQMAQLHRFLVTV